MTSSVFAGMRKGKTYEKGNYLSPGDFDLEIKRCFVKKSRKGKNLFTVEFKVVHSTSPAHLPESKATWQQDLGDADIAWGSLKQFMYAVLGLDPAKDQDAIAKMDIAEKNEKGEDIEGSAPIEKLTDDAATKNALEGIRVHVKTWIKKTVAKNADFTVHDWSPYKKAA